MVLLFWGQDIFNLHFERGTPFYADEDWIETHPEFTIWEPTNKCYLYTCIFQAFVFMQLFN